MNRRAESKRNCRNTNAGEPLRNARVATPSVGRPGAAVTLVASGALGALYESALEAAGVAPTIVDADAAVRSGLAVAARALWDL